MEYEIGCKNMLEGSTPVGLRLERKVAIVEVV